jgi:hypothetical protein
VVAAARCRGGRRARSTYQVVGRGGEGGRVC